MLDIPCVILSGGASRRMGEDKSLMPFKGFDTLIEYQHNKLSKIFSTVYISSKTNKFNFPAKLLLDQSSEIFSPMIALHAILSSLKAEKVFITTVDVPFVKQSTFELLVKNSLPNQLTLAKDISYTHNLCGVFSCSLLPFITLLLDDDIHKIRALRNHIDTYQEVLFSDVEQFVNINTKDEYNKYIL